MAKYTVATTWREVPILTDGKFYYVDDGFGDFDIFNSLDDAIARIEGV